MIASVLIETELQVHMYVNMNAVQLRFCPGGSVNVPRLCRCGFIYTHILQMNVKAWCSSDQRGEEYPRQSPHGG